jgi:hypothetical protein
MIEYSQIVGKQEDWAQVVTNVQMVDTPFLGWLPVGKNPVQAERLYQGDYFDDPVTNSHADGKPVDGGKSAGRNRAQLRSLIQYMTKAANVTKLDQDLGNVAGVADELAAEITKQTKELSKDIEAAFLSAQECRIGISGTSGYMTRGVPNWIQTTDQAVYPVNANLKPPSASISTTATASLTEDVVLNILQSVGSTTRSTRTITAFVGPSGQRAFNNFPIFVPSTASTVNAGAYPSEIRGGVLDRGIKRYASPFGDVDLVLSYNNHTLDAASTSTLRSHSAYFLHQDMWEVAWSGGGMPKWVQKPYIGGQYEAFCEAILMLTCWNPKGEAKYEPAT